MIGVLNKYIHSQDELDRFSQDIHNGKIPVSKAIGISVESSAGRTTNILNKNDSTRQNIHLVSLNISKVTFGKWKERDFYTVSGKLQQGAVYSKDLRDLPEDGSKLEVLEDDIFLMDLLAPSKLYITVSRGTDYCSIHNAATKLAELKERGHPCQPKFKLSDVFNWSPVYEGKVSSLISNNLDEVLLNKILEDYFINREKK